MTKGDSDLYVELAELVRANVSGPVGQEMVAKAQNRLVDRLKKNGAISTEEADSLNA